MPATKIYLFRRADSGIPLIDWLDGLEQREPKVYEKCLQRIMALANRGSELQRPLSAPLGDGLHELRIRRRRVNYRMLYFFHGKAIAVLTHGFTKEGKIPVTQINRAKKIRALVRKDFKKHTAEWET